MEHVAEWATYLELERRGARPVKLAALLAFVETIEKKSPDVRAAWVTMFLRQKFEGEQVLPVRAALFERVLFPELSRRYSEGDAAASLRLAQLSQELLRYPVGWHAVGSPGEIDLWREAHRRDKASEPARAGLVAATLRFIRYALHEVPSGVLYGANGASIEECRQLQADLLALGPLLTPTERESSRRLLQLAELHYSNYIEYLAQGVISDYPTFLAEQGLQLTGRRPAKSPLRSRG